MKILFCQFLFYSYLCKTFRAFHNKAISRRVSLSPRLRGLFYDIVIFLFLPCEACSSSNRVFRKLMSNFLFNSEPNDFLQSKLIKGLIWRGSPFVVDMMQRVFCVYEFMCKDTQTFSNSEKKISSLASFRFGAHHNCR